MRRATWDQLERDKKGVEVKKEVEETEGDKEGWKIAKERR